MDTAEAAVREDFLVVADIRSPAAEDVVFREVVDMATPAVAPFTAVEAETLIAGAGALPIAAALTIVEVAVTTAAAGTMAASTEDRPCRSVSMERPTPTAMPILTTTAARPTAMIRDITRPQPRIPATT